MEDALITFSGYLIAVLSAIFAIVQLRLKHRTEKENLKLQHRLERSANYSDKLFLKYQEHLRTINALVHEAERNLDGSGLAGQIAGAKYDLSQTTDNDLAIRLEAYIERTIDEWRNVQYQRIEDLDNLKLFAGDELSASLDRFAECVSKLVNINAADPWRAPDDDDADIDKEAQRRLYDEMTAERRVIEKLMRSDIRPSA